MSDSDGSNAGSSPENNLDVALPHAVGSAPAHAAHAAGNAPAAAQAETERSGEASTSGVDEGGPSTALDVRTTSQDPAARRDPGELTRKRNRVGDLILKERRKQGSMVVNVSEHSATLAAGFQQLRENEQLCDVTIRVDGKDFKAHRAVLAASSEMLNVMLLGQWSDSNDKVIELYGVDQNSFSLLLDFMYKGSVAVDKLDDMLNLLLSSEHLGMATVDSSQSF